MDKDEGRPAGVAKLRDVNIEESVRPGARGVSCETGKRRGSGAVGPLVSVAL